VRLGDRNRDGRADLTVGITGENGKGAVWHARAGGSGITTTGSVTVTAGEAGLTTSFTGFGTPIAP
jgi:hypothetical protein